MDTTRKNLLDAPEATDTIVERMNRALAHLLLDSKAFPVYPDAEKSTHPMWKDYGLYSKFRFHSDPVVTVVKVFTIEEVSWTEFADTYSPNDNYYGFVGEVELSNGWTGRYSIDYELGDAINYIKDFEKAQESN